MTETTAIVMPAVTPVQAVEAFQAYQDLAKQITTVEDVQKIGDREFKKKSFWRKCQRFFNLSLEIQKEWKEANADGSFTYFAVYRATAPNGAHCDGDGACTSNEKGRVRTEHDTRSTAHTRAKNRAISDLVAFGEVSAEEVETIESHAVDMITAKQIAAIGTLAGKKGYTLDQIKQFNKVSSLNDLTKEKASGIIDALDKRPNVSKDKQPSMPVEEYDAAINEAYGGAV